jgi:hypothetical protein
MKPGFLHVFIIERTSSGWLCIDPNRSELGCSILPVPPDVDMIPEFAKQNPKSTILHIHAYPTLEARFPRPGVISCVGVAQYILGVHWWNVFTPHMLYNKLMKDTTPHLKVINHDGYTRTGTG